MNEKVEMCKRYRRKESENVLKATMKKEIAWKLEERTKQTKLYKKKKSK